MGLALETLPAITINEISAGYRRSYNSAEERATNSISGSSGFYQTGVLRTVSSSQIFENKCLMCKNKTSRFSIIIFFHFFKLLELRGPVENGHMPLFHVFFT